MVIRHIRQLEASELVDQDYFSLTFVIQRRHDDTRKPIMVIRHLCQPEASEPVNRDYFSLTFVI